MRIHIIRISGVTVLRCHGRLVLGQESTQFRMAAERALAECDVVALDLAGASELIELETGRGLVVQPETARSAYAERVGTWLSGLASTVRREGMDYLRLTTADVLERELRRFLISRRGAA